MTISLSFTIWKKHILNASADDIDDGADFHGFNPQK